MSSTKDKSSFQFELLDQTLFFLNSVTLYDIDRLFPAISDELRHYKHKKMEIDLRFVTEMDSAGVALIHRIKSDLSKRNVEIIVKQPSKSVQKILSTFAIPDDEKSEVVQKYNIFESLGQKAYTFVTSTLREFMYLTADLFYWTFVDLFQKKSHRKGEFVNQAVNIGVNAVPIVGLLSFMIGLVLALQSAAQLRQFGADRKSVV